MAKEKKQKHLTIFGKWDFTSTNYLIFLGGIVLIILAYVIMALGDATASQSVTLAPILLVIGYLVIIPLAIIYKPKKTDQEQK